MIIINCQQGDPTWYSARNGLPTASAFDRIITAKTAKRSESFEKYAHQLIAERILGYPLDSASSAFMERGNIQEARARRFYALQRDLDVDQVGFVLLDDKTAGCSPDGLVGTDGLLEIKCPTAPIHVGYLLDSDGIGYKQQVQGQLWICQRDWVDTVSYFPDLPASLVRQGRDEVYIKALSLLVGQFNEYIHECFAKLAKLGYVGAPERPALKLA